MVWHSAYVNLIHCASLKTSSEVTQQVFTRVALVALVFLFLAISSLIITNKIANRYPFEELHFSQEDITVSDSESDEELSQLDSHRFYKNLNKSSQYLRRDSFAQ